MKTFKFTNQLLSLLFIASLFVACSKDDGEDGAIGPQGPQGEQGIPGEDGADGEQGEQGEQGETGTANVIYSEWLDSPFDDVDLTETFANADLVALSLTEEIADQGTILVYGKTGGRSWFIPLVNASNESHYYFIEPENINLRIKQLDPTETLDASSDFDEYRYILIPGGVEASEGIGGITGKSSTDYSKMSYEEVVGQFNIPE